MTNNLNRFMKLFERFVGQQLKQAKTEEPVIEVDVTVPLQALDETWYTELQEFEPFGQQWPKPKFLSTVNIKHFIKVGLGKMYAIVTVEDRGSIIELFLMNSSIIDKFRIGDRVNIVYDIGMKTNRGKEEQSFKLIYIEKAQDEANKIDT